MTKKTKTNTKTAAAKTTKKTAAKKTTTKKTVAKKAPAKKTVAKAATTKRAQIKIESVATVHSDAYITSYALDEYLQDIPKEQVNDVLKGLSSYYNNITL